MKPNLLLRLFSEHFPGKPAVISSAPGRVNLIGEHTDYNDGYVFPAAIDRRTYVALRAAEGPQSRLVSSTHGPTEFSVLLPSQIEGWGRYIQGCGMALGDVLGETPLEIEGVVWSDIPIGSGLSSSAALDVSILTAWNALGGYGLASKSLAEIAWSGDNRYVGISCGIMDQMISAIAEEGTAMLLDTRSLEATFWGVPDTLKIAVLDTKKPRSLIDSAYNTRVAECQRALKVLQEIRPNATALRDFSLDDLDQVSNKLDDVAIRRAKHVISENTRTLQFGQALADNDLELLGTLCKESHLSLQNDYEVSCKELDALAECAWNSSGCIACRMTGAGFGGCCVALVQSGFESEFESKTLQSYLPLGLGHPEIFFSAASFGAKLHES